MSIRKEEMSLKSYLFTDPPHQKGANVSIPNTVKSKMSPPMATESGTSGTVRKLTFSSLGAGPTVGKTSAQAVQAAKPTASSAKPAASPAKPLVTHGMHDTSNALLMMERDQLRAKLNSMKEDNDRLCANVNAHKQHVGQLTLKIASYESAATDAKTILQSKEHDISILSGKLERAHTDLKVSTSGLQKACTQLNGLQKELGEMKRQETLLKEGFEKELGEMKRRETLRENHIMEMSKDLVSIKETCRSDIRGVLKACRLQLAIHKQQSTAGGIGPRSDSYFRESDGAPVPSSVPARRPEPASSDGGDPNTGAAAAAVPAYVGISGDGRAVGPARGSGDQRGARRHVRVWRHVGPRVHRPDRVRFGVCGMGLPGP